MKLGPYTLGYNDTPEAGIYHGDARALAAVIPDESVDLIFTDPVYDRIEDYEWLAECAARVLKPDGALLVWSNGKWHRKNTNWLENAGLTYRHDFACVISTGSAPMYGRIIAKTNRVIWMDKSGQSRMESYLADGYMSRQWSRIYKFGPWTKNPLFIRQAMENFGGIVFDPFTGGGTVPAVCKQLRRPYLAFEIDGETVDMARERVHQTQPPLFVMEPAATQAEMNL